MRREAALVLAAVVLAVAGCSSSSGLGESSPSPVDEGADLTAPPDPTVPYSASEAGEAGPESAVSAPGKAPSESKWSKEGVTSDRRQLDTEACYRFAWAQVDNDIRIDRDISSARNEFFSQYSRLTDYTQRVDSYYYERQRNSRFNDCMRSKGYDVE